MTKFQVDIVSDVVCPWCYIGHTRLTKAITAHQKKHPSDTFKLTYYPYYLNPPSRETFQSTSFFPVVPPSRPREEVYAEKFGHMGIQPSQIWARLSGAASSDGLDFKFGGKTGSSRNGHRLVRYAQSHGGEDAQNKTMLGLWRRYYEQEIDITELDVLIQVGVEAGLGTSAEIKDYLLAQGSKKEEALKDVKNIDRETQEASYGKGISGVPNYEIGISGQKERYEVSGAQDPRMFETVFEKFRELEQSKIGHGEVTGSDEEMNGEACEIGGEGKC